MATTEAQLRKYCVQHRLYFVDRPELDEVFGPDEWEGFQCAGFFDHPGMGGACAVMLDDEGTFKAFAINADGEKFMEDKFVDCAPDEVSRSIERGRPLHLVG